MIRFATLFVLTLFTGFVAVAGVAGTVGGLAMLAVSIAGFSLMVSLFNELFRPN